MLQRPRIAETLRKRQLTVGNLTNADPTFTLLAASERLLHPVLHVNNRKPSFCDVFT